MLGQLVAQNINNNNIARVIPQMGYGEGGVYIVSPLLEWIRVPHWLGSGLVVLLILTWAILSS